ncbi:MAG: HEAT repeat domain-containing protein [Acidobacteria bacterium]|nr:HEAT repeat domain-containing protein [Acidobacteriota bacterium]
MGHVADTSFSIQELERVFAESPKLGHEQLQQWKAEHHADFLRQAIELLESGQGNSFSQIVLKLLRQDSSSLKQLVATADLLSLDDSIRMLRVASKNDAGYQNHLVTNVKSEIDTAGAWVAKQELTRVLEILSKAVDAEHLEGILALLSEHPDPRLRSKVAMLAGSLLRHQPKCVALLKDADPRVRANAVASLWGRRDTESIQTFKEASLDSHHRVIANGLFGLYQAGEISSVRGILKLVRDADLDRQLAGGWLIGQTADPRFLAVVEEYLTVKTGRVKLGLLNASRKIKKRLSDLKSKPALGVELVCFDRLEKGRVRASLMLRRADGSAFELNELMATQVVLRDGDLRVDQFHFEARGSKEASHTVFLIPQKSDAAKSFHGQMEQGMEMAIARKRPSDYWSIQKYNTRTSTAQAEPTLIDFSVNAESLIKDQLKDLDGASASLAEGLELAIGSFPASSGRKHLVLVLDPDLGNEFEVPPHWPALFEKQGVVLYVVCCGELSEATAQSLWQLCSARRGAYLELKVESKVPAALGQLASALPGCFYLTYLLGRSLPNPDPLQRVTIEVLPPDGYGRIVIQENGELVVDDPTGSSDSLNTEG